MCLPVHCIGLAATDYHSAIIDHGCAQLCASAVLCVCTVFMCTCYVCTWLYLDVFVWKYTVGLLCWMSVVYTSVNCVCVFLSCCYNKILTRATWEGEGSKWLMILSSWCESSHSRIQSRLSHCIHCQKVERWTLVCQSLSPFSSVQSSSFWMVAPTLRTGLPTSALNLENVLQTCLELCFPDDSSW